MNNCNLPENYRIIFPFYPCLFALILKTIMCQFGAIISTVQYWVKYPFRPNSQYINSNSAN